ncbi:MAG: C4-type zinc ribbon domain-containing protein [Anaerolineales bacterium]|nr:C4-type zinc ribbon domain-containing protein [Anaerolineales bacterium]
MSASLGIYRLQQVDRQIDHARAQLDTIRKTLENDAELRAALSQVETTQTQNQRALHEMKNAEAGVDSQKIKIEQAEASLYGGSVKNPKELQDLQKDVASLKKYFATLEERQLETMLKAEAAESELQIAGTELEKIQARLGSEHGKLIQEQLTLSKQLERLTEEREAAHAPIESSLLQTYDGLRQQKRGVAVAEINDNACASCGTTLNASIQQNARSQKQLVNCPSCGRILFAN